MRGTKLTAWALPPLWKQLDDRTVTGRSSDSQVLAEQGRLRDAVRRTLSVISCDIETGLLETVGIKSSLSEADLCSILIELPATADPQQIARAIDLENVEAWCDSQGRLHVGIGPWFTTKDIDQVVLTVTKVLHVLLGLHASSASRPVNFIQKLLIALRDILVLQSKMEQKKR